MSIDEKEKNATVTNYIFKKMRACANRHLRYDNWHRVKVSSVIYAKSNSKNS